LASRTSRAARKNSAECAGNRRKSAGVMWHPTIEVDAENFLGASHLPCREPAPDRRRPRPHAAISWRWLHAPSRPFPAPAHAHGGRNGGRRLCGSEERFITSSQFGSIENVAAEAPFKHCPIVSEATLVRRNHSAASASREASCAS
jgi:hypothetical protein